MTTIVVRGIQCPTCGAEEVANPTAPLEDQVLNIRGFKVCDDNGNWWSQCLICAEHQPKNKGWFK